LKLPGEVKPFFDRALAAGVNHERIREFDVKFHNNLNEFQNAIGNEIRKIKGTS